MSKIEKGVCSLGRTPLKVVMRLKPAKINASVKTFFLSDKTWKHGLFKNKFPNYIYYVLPVITYYTITITYYHCFQMIAHAFSN